MFIYRIKIIFLIAILSQIILSQPRRISKTSFESKINKNLNELNNVVNSKSDKKEIYHRLMILYNNNAYLYETLWQTASNVNLKYFNKLLDKKKNNSDYTFFYKGICEYQLGNYNQAIRSLEQFIHCKNILSNYRLISKIWLGAAYFLDGNSQMANKYWRVKAKNRETKSEYNFLISTINKNLYITNDIDLNLCQTNRDIKNFITNELMRPNSNSWWELQKALSMVNIRDPDYIDLNKTDKHVDFYDTSILQAIYIANYYLSFFYANMFNSLASVDEQINGNSNFYRGEYYYKMKEYNKALNAFKGYNSGDGYIYFGASLYLNGDSLKSEKIFKEIENNSNYKLRSVLIKIYDEINFPIDSHFASNVRKSIINNNNYRQNKIIFQEYLNNCFVYYIHKKDYLTAYKYYQESLIQSHSERNNFIYMIRFLESLILSENYTLIGTEANPLIATIEIYLPSIIFLNEPIGKINILINGSREIGNEVYK